MTLNTIPWSIERQRNLAASQRITAHHHKNWVKFGVDNQIVWNSSKRINSLLIESHHTFYQASPHDFGVVDGTCRRVTEIELVLSLLCSDPLVECYIDQGRVFKSESNMYLVQLSWAEFGSYGPIVEVNYALEISPSIVAGAKVFVIIIRCLIKIPTFN